MRSVVFCYAPQDHELACAMGEYLSSNFALNCCYEEGVIRRGEELLDVVGRALSAEVVVLLLSPESVPARWDRSAWEPVLLEQAREFGSLLVFAVARECHFPALLRRQPFCEFTGDRRTALRRLKQLILHQTEPGAEVATSELLEELRCSLADRPGWRAEVSRETAVAFVKTCERDFEEAFWIDGARRSACGMVGEMASRLGLRLSGSLEQNQQTLKTFCREHRCLFVLEHVDVEQAKALAPGGLTSTIVTAPQPVPAPMPLAELDALFAGWVRDEARCLRSLGDAWHYVQSEPWRTVRHLGPAVLSVLKNQDRLAEANEILEILLAHAREQGDTDALYRFEWERSWIL